MASFSTSPCTLASLAPPTSTPTAGSTARASKRAFTAGKKAAELEVARRVNHDTGSNFEMLRYVYVGEA